LVSSKRTAIDDGSGSDLRLMMATGLALASARSAFMVTMMTMMTMVIVVIAMAINATDTLIIIDVGTLGIARAGVDMVVGIITGGGWRPDHSYGPATQFKPQPGGNRLGLRECG
jgi:hypothetical protein